MRPTLIKKILSICILFSIFGCQTIKAYTRKEFIIDVKEVLNIDDPIAFKLIDQNDDLSKALDSNFAYYVLYNFIMLPEKINKDNSYLKYQKLANEYNLIIADNDCHQEKIRTVIEHAKKIKDNRQFKSIYDIKYKHKIREVEKPSIINGKLIDDYHEDEFIKYYDHHQYMIKKIVKEADGLKMIDVDLAEIFDEVNLENEFELNFDEAQIEVLNPSITINNRVGDFQMISADTKNHLMKIDGYDIGYKLNSNSIGISITNNTKHGIMYADIEAFDFKPKIKLKKNSTDDYRYFTVEFKTSEKFGFKKQHHRQYYGNFDQLSGKDFISNITSLFNKKQETIEKIIPIMKIKTPIPNVPLTDINITLSVYIYASGKAELRFDTGHKIGFENYGTSLRMINDFKSKHDYNIEASIGSTLGLSFGIGSLGQNLADIKVDTGLKGQMDNILNVFDHKGNYQRIETDLPSDYINNMAKGNGNVKLCTELSLFWVLKITFNSSNTLMNKMGITKTIDIFKDDKQLLKNKIIMENFHPVSKCNVSKKSVKKDDIKLNDKKLLLKYYHRSLNLNDSFKLEILSYPNTYQFSDLTFTSDNKEIASVSDNGLITAKKSGSTVIRITTKDNKYSTYINIFVRGNNVN